jgi:hypothetical protein
MEIRFSQILQISKQRSEAGRARTGGKLQRGEDGHWNDGFTSFVLR